MRTPKIETLTTLCLREAGKCAHPGHYEVTIARHGKWKHDSEPMYVVTWWPRGWCDAPAFEDLMMEPPMDDIAQKWWKTKDDARLMPKGSLMSPYATRGDLKHVTHAHAKEFAGVFIDAVNALIRNLPDGWEDFDLRYRNKLQQQASCQP